MLYEVVNKDGVRVDYFTVWEHAARFAEGYNVAMMALTKDYKPEEGVRVQEYADFHGTYLPCYIVASLRVMMRYGEKMEAIKCLRDYVRSVEGVAPSLRECKEYVETFAPPKPVSSSLPPGSTNLGELLRAKQARSK